MVFWYSRVNITHGEAIVKYGFLLLAAGIALPGGVFAQDASPTAQTAATATALVTASATATPTAAPTGEPRCVVTGWVNNILKGEGRNLNGEAISVPVVTMHVEQVTPLEPGDTRPFCQKMVGRPLPGEPMAVNFRVCDSQADFYISDRIRAVAGRNLGGGYYCIDQVTRSAQ